MIWTRNGEIDGPHGLCEHPYITLTFNTLWKMFQCFGYNGTRTSWKACAQNTTQSSLQTMQLLKDHGFPASYQYPKGDGIKAERMRRNAALVCAADQTRETCGQLWTRHGHELIVVLSCCVSLLKGLCPPRTGSIGEEPWQIN